jgi:hypothetical protein
MPRPTLSALMRDWFGRAKRRLKGKPSRDRLSIGRRQIFRGASANDILIRSASSSLPLAVSRLGTTENAVVKYYVENHIDGECAFPDNLSIAIKELSGFFPLEDQLLSQFSRETLENLREIDVMAVRSDKREHAYWGFEDFFISRFARASTLIDLNALVPLGNPQSWTKHLKGRKVLVIHPFAHTVTQQFAKRQKLFDVPEFLPDCDLDVLPAVQSVGDNSSRTGFTTWFDALDYMKREIARRDFDVALIGAGAYGLFLAAECKRLGKVGIHIGGATQLLFGILGKRWTDPSSPDSGSVLPFINQHWTGPKKAEFPEGASKVEGGCYWV